MGWLSMKMFPPFTLSLPAFQVVRLTPSPRRYYEHGYARIRSQSIFCAMQLGSLGIFQRSHCLKQRLICACEANSLTGRSIDDILPFSPNTTLSLYIAEIAVKHADILLRTMSLTLTNLIPLHDSWGQGSSGIPRFIDGMRKPGTIIHELYAVGTSPFGIQMCRDIGITTEQDLPKGSGRIAFRSRSICGKAVSLSSRAGCALCRKSRQSGGYTTIPPECALVIRYFCPHTTKYRKECRGGEKRPRSGSRQSA